MHRFIKGGQTEICTDTPIVTYKQIHTYTYISEACGCCGCGDSEVL